MYSFLVVLVSKISTFSKPHITAIVNALSANL